MPSNRKKPEPTTTVPEPEIPTEFLRIEAARRSLKNVVIE